jgi:hypothetical protein
LLIDDLEAERLIERDVARGAGLQEGGAPVRPGQVKAMHHEPAAKSSPLRGRCDRDQVQEPAGLAGQVSAEPVPERRVADAAVIGQRVDGRPGGLLDLVEPPGNPRRQPRCPAVAAADLPQDAELDVRLQDHAEQLLEYLRGRLGHGPADHGVVVKGIGAGDHQAGHVGGYSQFRHGLGMVHRRTVDAAQRPARLQGAVLTRNVAGTIRA